MDEGCLFHSSENTANLFLCRHRRGKVARTHRNDSLKAFGVQRWSEISTEALKDLQGTNWIQNCLVIGAESQASLADLQWRIKDDGLQLDVGKGETQVDPGGSLTLIHVCTVNHHTLAGREALRCHCLDSVARAECVLIAANIALRAAGREGKRPSVGLRSARWDEAYRKVLLQCLCH